MRIPHLSGVYLLLGGFISLAGWVLDIPRLADWYGHGISTQPNAAVCVILSGLALLTLATGRRRAARLAGSGVLLVGAATLLQWISGLQLGIDRLLLFSREWGQASVVFPGRMGPPASLAWTLIGTSLIVTTIASGARKLAPILCVTTAAVSFLSLTGYIYDAHLLFSHPYATAIALQTSTFILAASLGVIACHHDAEPMRMLLDHGTAGRLARRSLALILLLPAGLAYLGVAGQEAGLYDSRMSAALFALVFVLVIALLVWRALHAVRAATELLRRERDFLGRLIEASPVAIAVVRGPELRFAMLNAAYRAIAGSARSPDIGRTFSEIFPEAAERGAADELRRVMETGIAWKVRDFRTPIGDRAETWWEGEVLPLATEGKKPDSALILTWDITDRKIAEKAITDSELRYRSLVSVIADVPWTADATGQFAGLQESWTRYTGQQCPEYRGHGWLEALHPDDRENVRLLWEQACRERTQYHASGRIWHAETRTYRNFEARATPVFDAGGVVREWVGTCTDVHDRVASEQELRLANRRKDEFLATLAHELRNPLAPVRNAAHVLRLKGADALPWAAQMIERQVSHIARLIDDLMDVSRINQGKLELRREPVDLASIVHAAIDATRPLVDEQRHELTVDLPGAPVYVDADVTRLTQVFGNLLNNACRYTDPGGRIHLAVRAGGEGVAVTIEDNGIGIPPDMLKDVFELFVQVDQSIERTRGGLGVGLALVKRLVELHGGRVAVRSEGSGKGSAFTIHLPVLAAEPVMHGLETGAGAPVPAGRHRVLIVDDNRDAADSLASLLQSMGNEVRTAYEGAHAVQLADAFLPEVVLLDIGLPKLSGYDVARMIRAKAWARRALLVAVTGWGQDADRVRTSAAGFDRHLVKPVSPDVIIQLLASLPPDGGG